MTDRIAVTATPAGTMLTDRYRIVRTLGQGAFGQTLLADDLIANRQVAIKVLHAHRAEDWKSYELFEREAKVLSALRHHGVPEVHEVLRTRWEGGDAGILVMEFIEGRSLAAIIEQREPLDPADVSHIFLELLGILDYLHGRVPPILHRDIKPSNIIVRPNGFPALVDFGAVRSVIAPSGENGSTIVGTYGYMPYEQHMGQATPSSDLYALAATFLHLATGRTPPEFMGSDGRLEVPDGIPGGRRWRDVLARMLRPSPAERFQSAREVRQALTESEHAPTLSGGAMPATVARRLPDRPPLGPAPRTVTGEVARRFREVAPSAWNYFNNHDKPTQGFDTVSFLVVAFFSVMTMGVLPIIFGSQAAARRRHLRAFFRDGIATTATVTAIQDERAEFRMKVARVRYEFEVGGALYRDADEVFASVANKWRPGDLIEILYLPARNYDSVIISTL